MFLTRLSIYLYVFVAIFVALSVVTSNDSYGDFTIKPADVLKVEIGKEAIFNWQYNAPGSPLVLEKWCKLDPSLQRCTTNILMTRTPASRTPIVLQSNTEYASRTIGQAPLTMKIRDIRLSDDGTFEFSAIFQNGVTFFDRVRLMVLVKPIINLKTTGNRIVTEGQKLRFECGVGTGNPKPFTIEWWHNNVMLSSTKSNFQAPLIFNSTLRKDSGIYRCIAKNDAGQDSYDINLSVQYPPENVIIVPSSNGVVRVSEGGNLTLQCQARGFPTPTYSWTRIRQFYREKLTENEVKSSIYFPYIYKNMADQYECAASNVRGKRTAVVIMDVLFRPEQMNFTINSNSSVAYAIIGSKVNMTCSAESSPPADFRIGFQGSPTAKAIGTTFIIEAAKITDSGIYECSASNGIGLPVTKLARLIVVVAPSDINVAGNPPNSILVAGTNLALTCEMKGTPRPHIFWMLNGKFVMYDSIRKIFNGTRLNVAREEIHFSRIDFRPLRRFDGGEYTCFASNYGGVIERKYSLDVNYAPYITIFPKNVTVMELEPAELSCKAIGKPPLSAYMWKHNGIVKNTEASERIYFPQARRTDGGLYSCAGINTVGNGKEAYAYLTVMYKPELTVIPPLSQTVNESVNIRLQCNATGVPKPLMLWTKDDLRSNTVLHRGEILWLYNVGYKQKGTYYCTASNKIGNTTASSVLLVNHAPVITTKDPSSTQIGADVGANAPPAQLTCTVDAYPAATITWSRGLTAVESGTSGFSISVSGSTSILTVTMSSESRRGSYTCKAVNRLGEVSQEYKIRKKGQPDPPVSGSLTATDTLEENDPPTSKIELRWIRGFDGGYTVTFRLFYREQGRLSFQQINIGASPDNRYSLVGMKTETTYEFTIRAVNERGLSGEYVPYLIFTTKIPPPKRGSASVKRFGNSGTQVEVVWNINDKALAKSIIVRYKRVIDSGWRQQTTSNINGTMIISSLDNEQQYEFQVFIVYRDGTRGLPVSAGQIVPGGGVTSEPRSGLKKQDIIAIVIGVGGFLLILIIVCTLVLLKRNKRRGVDGHFDMNSFGRGKGGNIGYSTGGSDVVRGAGILREDPDDDEDANDDDDDYSGSEPLQRKPQRKDSPPSYNDHFSYYDGTDEQGTSLQPPKHPVGNTPAYSSFSALSNPKRPLLPDAEPVAKSGSRTSLTGRAAEISRKTKNPFESMDYRGRNSRDPYQDGYDDYLEPDVRGPYKNDRGRQYHTQPAPKSARPGSSGGLSTDEDLPSPPPFMKDMLTNVHSDSERVPGSLGDRLGKNRNSRPSPQHSPSSQRSAASSNQYRSDTEYIEDDGDDYVGYLV